MQNILYIDDYINFYNKKINIILISKPYKNTLKNGKIIDRKKFIKYFNKIKDNYHLDNNIFSESILIIINPSYSKEDKYNLKEIFEELNYKNVKFINELELINFNNNCIFINYNFTYLNIYYINSIGNIEMKIYENDYINKSLIINILKIINKDKIIIAGKNIIELINKLDNLKYNFYYYEDSDTLFIKLLKNKIV